jgi:uncharacterized protein YidB (DUF937 family)
MGLLDDILKGGGGASALGSIAKLAAENPQAVAAVISLLSSKDTSVGDAGGLAGVVNAFQKKGLGDMVASWISTGPNPPVSAGQVTDVLGPAVLKQFAAKAGVPHSQASELLASLLPTVIDHLTPEGKAPQPEALESSLGGLLSSFLK